MSSSSDVVLTLREAFSGIFGSISLAAWIFLLIPQLVENYKLGSAEGISTVFLLVWLVGDLSNLIGAVWAGLVPTVIALAIYFCIADFVLLSQCFYYNHIKKSERDARDSAVDSQSIDDSERPLLDRRNSEIIGLPGSRRRSSAASRKRRDSYGSLIRPDHDEIATGEEQSALKTWLTNTFSVLIIIAAGTLGWVFAWRSGAWSPVSTKGGGSHSDGSAPLGAEIFGYLSSVCYLGARIPQIIKNFQNGSCSGLSLLFFILSIIGNLTYGAGILFHSTTRPYVVTNLPWLLGSLGTVFEDILIFVQFRIYRDSENKENPAVEAEG
ncbi:MAG: hypothetical protein M1814_000454 [Vezdaea aestivalis]|nr:MAG: hypothetical protein M1814_000454 [Vezdaea aestivalis]